MSEINQQLNALSRQQSLSGTQPPPLQAAVVQPVQARRPWMWAIAGFGLLAVAGSAGWWLGARAQHAVATAAVAASVPSVTNVLEPESLPERAVKLSPVAAVTEPKRVVSSSAESTAAEISTTRPVEKPASQRVAAQPLDMKPAASVQAAPREDAVAGQVNQALAAPRQASAEQSVPTAQQPSAPAGQAAAPSIDKASPAKGSLAAKTKLPAPAESVEPDDAVDAVSADEALIIETVELDGEQLSRVAYQKAEKALKTGDSRKAIRHLREAVQYQPSWTLARQKLAALQYGRGEIRQALATLQEGLALDDRQPDLRLTMAKLLVNESQPQAALNVLNRLPSAGHEEYLAMRGALAQQLAHIELAMSSYQQLVKEQPYDGRWWMGLGIALEQSQAAPERARDAYQQALLMGRISQQSQQFIQQRLALLEAQEG